MRKVTAAVMASTLAVGALTSQAAQVPTDESWHPAETLTQRNSVQSHMFD
ncbi:cell-envelope stress modulator CpxP, partial [Escherichia coli]